MTHGENWNASEITAAVKLALFINANKCNKAVLMSGLAIQINKLPVDMIAHVNAALARGETIGAKVGTGEASPVTGKEIKRAVNGAVERKVWNVSAILEDSGRGIIPGFKYLSSFEYQHAMIDFVAIALRVPVAAFLNQVNKGRASYAKRAAAGEFSDTVNAALVARRPITLESLQATALDTAQAEKENRETYRAANTDK